MYQSQQKRAWNRGVRLAGLWKRAKANLLKWDRKCVVWAKAHRLESWIGHIPVFLLCCGSLALLILSGGFIFKAIVMLLFSMCLFFPASSSQDSSNQDSTGRSYKNPTAYDSNGELGPGHYADSYKTSDDY